MTTQYARNSVVLAALHNHYSINGTGSHIKRNDFALVTFAPIIITFVILLVLGIIVGFLLLMREKKKRIQEATSLSNLPWLETLEVFAVTGSEARPGMFLPPPSGAVIPSPPPTYDTVVKVSEKSAEANRPDQKAATLTLSPMRKPNTKLAPLNSDDLPTYNAAIQKDGHM